MVTFACLLYASSSTPLSDRLVERLENSYKPLDPALITDSDIYVVLGGGIIDNAPDIGGNGAPTGETMLRLAQAVRLYRLRPLPVIVSSGKGFGCRMPEAPVMKKYLVQMGVPEKDIFVEDESRNTRENAGHVRKFAEKLGRKRMVLITSAFHMKRAVFSFKNAGVGDLLPAPADYRASRCCYDFIDYMPSLNGLLNTSIVMHEKIGRISYRIFARLRL